MIELTCTQCRNRLQIDDGFAGGVCRCNACGTIQTVPGSAGASGAPGGGRSKPLFRAGPRAGESLDELADVVASSGLGGSRLRKASTGLAAASRGKWLITAAATALLLVAVVAVLFFALPAGEPATPASFAGVPLDGPRVVFLLDRGTATAGQINALRDSALAAAGQLDAEDTFKILFWADARSIDGRVGDVEGTGEAWLSSSPADVELARERIRNVGAVFSSEPWKALSMALAGSPDELLIATGKGWQLEPGFSDRVLEARGVGTTRIHVVALGDEPDNDHLRRLAEATGGVYRHVPDLAAGVLRP
ncbi:MAG: hypothetical protein ACFCVE_01670 [Phycisphaerae bacterium]